MYRGITENGKIVTGSLHQIEFEQVSAIVTGKQIGRAHV